MVEFCCARDGGLLSENFYILRSLLGSSYLLDKPHKELLHIETVLLSKITTPLLAERCLKDLDNLEKFIQDDKIKHQINTFRSKVLKHKIAIENPETRKATIKEQKSKAEKILTKEKGFGDEGIRLFSDYSGQFSNWRPGNWVVGGQLPASNINRFDREYFGKLINEPLSSLLDTKDMEGIPITIQKLSDAPDVDTFCQIANKIIRAQYNTTNLERYGEKHDVFDQTVHGYMTLTGAGDVEVRKYLPDSRTNIAEHFRRGIGDCRAHTQTLQLMYEMWKEVKYNENTIKIDELRGDTNTSPTDYIEGVFIYTDEMDTVLRNPLRFIDVEVHIPLKKDAKGFPVWHGDHMVMNESGKPIKAEEHTLNVKMSFDESGKLQKMETKDSFYHNTYPWESQEITFKGRDFKKDGFFAGHIEMYNEERGEVVKVPVLIKPTAWTGQPPEYNKNSDTPRFMGVPMSAKDQEATLVKQRERNLKDQENIRSFYKEKT